MKSLIFILSIFTLLISCALSSNNQMVRFKCPTWLKGTWLSEGKNHNSFFIIDDEYWAVKNKFTRGLYDPILDSATDYSVKIETNQVLFTMPRKDKDTIYWKVNRLNDSVCTQKIYTLNHYFRTINLKRFK